MNTQKTHDRFWEAMRARFGLRWLTEFGDKPTPPWIQLLNRFTPLQLKEALELMVPEKFAHPPTMPQFEALLVRAAAKRPENTTDWSRGYWRSIVISQGARDFWLAKIIPRETDFEPYLIQHRDELEGELHHLLDRAVMLERDTGQRTDGIHEMVRHRIFELATERSPYWQRLIERRKAGEPIPRVAFAA